MIDPQFTIILTCLVTGPIIALVVIYEASKLIKYLTDKL